MATSSIQGIELITRLTQNGVATEFKSTRRCVSMDLVTVRPPTILSVFWGNFSPILLLYPGECYI